MLPFFIAEPWNAHSAHVGGDRAAAAVAAARFDVATLIGADPSEIVFTSGATEANNIALLGVARAALEGASSRRRILTTAIEHKCVLETAAHLAAHGFVHEIIPVDRDGFVDLGELESRLGNDVLLVSTLAASNEIGTIQPVVRIGALAAEAGAVFHVDAAQAAGRVPFDVVEAGCDLVSVSAHKLRGPKGVGALYVSAASPVRPMPIMFGGQQEKGLRPGTLPVALIAGFGRAARLARERMPPDAVHARELALVFEQTLADAGVIAELNGAREPRLPGSLNLRVSGTSADDVVARLANRVLLSTGSACMSGEVLGSYVLAALGLCPADVAASFRLCFDCTNTVDEAVAAAKLLAETIAMCRNATGGNVQ